MKTFRVEISDDVSFSSVEAKLCELDEGVEVYEEMGGTREAVVELLSRHHNYPNDVNCPLYGFLVGWAKVDEGARALGDERACRSRAGDAVAVNNPDQ